MVLTDKITDRWRWEAYLQSRTQNGMDSKVNVFEANHMQNLWVWLSYKATDQLKIFVSPVGIFRSNMYIARPEEQQLDAVNEYRISLRLDQESKYARFSISTKVAAESRWRDLAYDGVYQQNFRFRYMLRGDVPVSRRSDGTSRFTFSAYNETMIQAGAAVQNNPNVFDQNRTYAGWGANLSRNTRLSVGYMFIVQQRLNGKDFDKGHVLWTILTFDNLFARFRETKS